MHRLPDLLCIKLEHVHVGLTSGEVGTSSTLVYHFNVGKINILATRTPQESNPIYGILCLMTKNEYQSVYSRITPWCITTPYYSLSLKLKSYRIAII